jgi:hypothetical protein
MTTVIIVITMIFVIVSPLNWIGHANRMHSKWKVNQVFNNNPQGSRIRGRPKNRWWNCVQTDINRRKIKNWKVRSKTEMTGGGPLRTAKVRIGLQCHIRRITTIIITTISVFFT